MSQYVLVKSDHPGYEVYLQGLISDSLQVGDYKGLGKIFLEIFQERQKRAVPLIIRFFENTLDAPVSPMCLAYPVGVEILGLFPDERAVPVLEKLIRKNIDFWFDEEVDESLEPAIIALSKCGKPGLLTLARMYTEEHAGFQHLVEYALDGKLILSPYTSHPEPDTIQKASDRHLARQFIDCLDEPNPLTRRGVVKALGKLNSSEAVEPLLLLLETEANPQVREEIVMALGELGVHGRT